MICDIILRVFFPVQQQNPIHLYLSQIIACHLFRCKCKWDAPPGVSSLGSATQHDEGGRRPRLSNSTAVAEDGMTTSVLRGAIFVNAEDVTIECDVEWHPQGGDVEWHPQGVSHVASSAVSFTAKRHSILYLEGSHDPDMMSEVIIRIERCCMVILFAGGRGTVSKG